MKKSSKTNLVLQRTLKKVSTVAGHLQERLHHLEEEVGEMKIKVDLDIAEKSRIRETKHLSTDADSITDTTVGWTKNTKNQIFLKNRKNHPKLKNSKISRDMPILAIYPSTRGL